MAKAFDTLSHRFMREVFKFLNFGPNLMKWLALYGENRTACILYEDNRYSKSFQLERGRAQGDNISPNTFNFADQILIWKIELDPRITGIWQNFLIPRVPEANFDNNFFNFEAARETSRKESIADDNTTLVTLSRENLAALRQILDSFGDISGLRCNYEKTSILKVGPVQPDVLPTYGFTYAQSIKLLGMEIKNGLTN